MRALALSLAVLVPTVAGAAEVPREFRGLWAETKEECGQPSGNNDNMYIEAAYLEQYETYCNLRNIKIDGNGRKADMSCKIGGIPRRGMVQISPTPDGRLVVDLRSDYFENGRLTLSLLRCGRDEKK